MNNDERIERLLLALEAALDIANEIWDLADIGIPISTHEQLEMLRGYVKHEREKQGTIDETKG